MQLPGDREIQERFDDLPQEVQFAIQSADMTAALTQVGQEHSLHVDQLGALEDETLLVMLGFANPAQFGERVQESIGVDAATAEAIAEEISARLFVPIRSAMRTYMEARLRRTGGAQQIAGGSMPPAATATFGAPPPSAAAQPSFATSFNFSPLAARSSQLALQTAPSIPMRPIMPAPQPISQSSVTSPAPGGGKIIMPAGIMPTVHPADQMLAQPMIMTPVITDFGTPGALQTPMTSAANQYATDPYREPAE